MGNGETVEALATREADIAAMLSAAEDGPALAGDTDTRVCAALLIAKDITEAARLAGVTRPTVYARLKDPAFMERLERERAALLEDVRGAISDALAEAARDALDALASIARGEPTPSFIGFDEYPSAADRIRAASEILRTYERDGGQAEA